MDAIEFYHTDECSTDIYEAMEQYKEHELKEVKDNLFYKAMHFKSDANPFEEGGECMVKDGYAHCEKSINEYLKTL